MVVKLYTPASKVARFRNHKPKMPKKRDVSKLLDKNTQSNFVDEIERRFRQLQKTDCVDTLNANIIDQVTAAAETVLPLCAKTRSDAP